MTIRSKVLLFSAAAIALIVVMGMFLHQGTTRGRRTWELVAIVQERSDIYGRLRGDAIMYLNNLLRARDAGEDTAAVLATREQRWQLEYAQLRALVEARARWLEAVNPEEERRQLARLEKAQRRWAERADTSLQGLSGGSVPGTTAMREAIESFGQEVEPLLAQAMTAEHALLESLSREGARNLRISRTVAVVVPLASLGLMLALAATILGPLHRKLRALLEGAERIGRGDLEQALPARDGDELDALAQAFNRMAQELKTSLGEKQRLLQAESEAAEREARLYSARLEETVRERTAELEATNARLAQSLQQLQATQAQLLSSDRLATVGRLAAGVGHEINNPLAYIISNLEYIRTELRQRDQLCEDVRQELVEALTESLEGAERVRLIVRDLKTLSREDDPGENLVDVREVVRSAAKLAGHELRHRARWSEDCEGVPPIQGSASRLAQVLLNLLVNAAQAIPPGRVEENEVRVVAREQPPGFVTLEVRDTGCGIPPDHLGRIFDPFFTTKPPGVGTGIGLSVCHTLVTAMGGELTVESEVGRGSVFQVKLPVARSAPSPSRVPSPPPLERLLLVSNEQGLGAAHQFKAFK